MIKRSKLSTANGRGMPSMPDMKNVRSKAGYDQEEAYFFEKDRELIAKIKGRPTLTLLPGGKGNYSLPAVPPGQQSGQKGSKKAA